MARQVFIAAAGFAALAFSQASQAQVNQHGYTLPLDLALAAAQEAEHVCAARGYPVTVTVVDVDGVQQVVLRGDHSTIHTRDSSFRKAYTVVTVGPINNWQTTRAFAEAVQKSPLATQLTTLPNVLALPGGVAIVANGETVAGIGVGGAPGTENDEACALAGIARIKDQLPK